MSRQDIVQRPNYIHGLNGVNLNLDAKISSGLLASICVLILICFATRCLQQANSHFRRMLTSSSIPTAFTYWSTESSWTWSWLKYHLLYAPLYKTRHAQQFCFHGVNMGCLPLRLHTCLLVSYICSNLVACFWLNHDQRPGAAIVAQLRGRTGHLAVFNMVPLILLAGRNNPFIKIMRISYDTCNLFHRWIGRLVIIQVILHTMAWAINAINLEGQEAAMRAIRNQPFLSFGMLGTTAMLLILFQSPSLLRHAFYEIFLHGHQLLALLTLIGTELHCIAGDVPGQSFIHWAAALWILERLARLARLIYLNAIFAKSRLGATFHIEALADKDGKELNVCRVAVTLARPVRIVPGAYCYIYIPTISLWMNHPFSIAWTTDGQEMVPLSSNISRFRAKIGMELPSSHDSVPDPSYHISNSTTTSEKGSNGRCEDGDEKDGNATRRDCHQTIHFIVAKRNGMTSKLFDKALQYQRQQSQSPEHLSSSILRLTGFIEGPYHTNQFSLSTYNTILLFAGGVGITHQLLNVRELLRDADQSVSAVKKIILIWSIRSVESIKWVEDWLDEILLMPGSKDVLDVRIFVSNTVQQQANISTLDTQRLEWNQITYGKVSLFPFRCCIPVIMQEQVRTRLGGMFVTVCGPGAFSDEVRHAVREHLYPTKGGNGYDRGCPSVDFVEETFSY